MIGDSRIWSSPTARLTRVEVFSADEVAVVHVMNRVVRRCFLLGDDRVTGKNYDHRKAWFEELLKRFAAAFGIDLLCFAIARVTTSTRAQSRRHAFKLKEYLPIASCQT